MRLYAALFVIGLCAYGAVAWDRLWRPSSAPHFVYQADAWLHGGTAIDPPLTGPGRVWLQTMPTQNLAKAIMPFIPKPSG